MLFFMLFYEDLCAGLEGFTVIIEQTSLLWPWVISSFKHCSKEIGLVVWRFSKVSDGIKQGQPVLMPVCGTMEVCHSDVSVLNQWKGISKRSIMSFSSSDSP